MQTLHQRQGGRDQAILAELGLAHRQDASVKVDIGDTQMQHLVEPEAAAIEQAEDFGHDEVAQRRACGRRELIDRVQQLLNLGVGQDAWARIRCWPLPTAIGPGHRRNTPAGTGTWAN